MRLIDADEVIRDLASLKYSKEYGKVGETYNLAIDDCIGEIKATPTALYAEPVKHGVWFGTVCSCCGASTSFSYDCEYCPHCGAKMVEYEDYESESGEGDRL